MKSDGIFLKIWFNFLVIVVLCSFFVLELKAIDMLQQSKYNKAVLGLLMATGGILTVVIQAYLSLWTNKLETEAYPHIISNNPYVEASKSQGFFFAGYVMMDFALAILLKHTNGKYRRRMYQSINADKIPKKIRQMILAYPLGIIIFFAAISVAMLLDDDKESKVSKEQVQIYNNQFRVTDPGTGKPKVNRRYKITNPKTVGLDDIDPKLTQDWVDICVGRYSLKVPPQLATPTGLTNYFDGFELKVLKNHTKESFDKLVLDKKRYIDRLPVPKELETAFHREHEDKNTYLVAYRSGIRKDPMFSSPSVLRIIGYKIIKDKILYLEGGSSDGYKNRFEGKKDKSGNVINWDQEFANKYANALRILNLAKPVKRTLLGNIKPGPGFCIDNAVVIAGKPVTERYYMADYSENENKLYKLSVEIDFLERLRLDPKPVVVYNKGGVIKPLNSNSFKGSYYRDLIGLGKTVRYVWTTKSHGAKTSPDKPVIIRIGFRGLHNDDQEHVDKVFFNIIASLILRQ